MPTSRLAIVSNCPSSRNPIFGKNYSSRLRERIAESEFCAGRQYPAWLTARFRLWGFLWGLQLKICSGLSQSVAGGKSLDVLIISTFHDVSHPVTSPLQQFPSRFLIQPK